MLVTGDCTGSRRLGEGLEMEEGKGIKGQGQGLGQRLTVSGDWCMSTPLLYMPHIALSLLGRIFHLPLSSQKRQSTANGSSSLDDDDDESL